MAFGLLGIAVACWAGTPEERRHFRTLTLGIVLGVGGTLVVIRGSGSGPRHAARQPIRRVGIVRRTHLGLIGIALTLPSCGVRDDAEVAPPMEDTPMTIRLESPAFEDGGDIPRRYTCDGEDLSPPLSWSGVPEPSRSLMLICDDPDAPRGTWTHWVVYDLPAGALGLTEGLPADEAVRFASGGSDHDARQGTNDFRKPGYGGPCPPSGTHRYFFRLYALDTTTGLGPGATRRQVEQAMQGHVLAQGQLMGRYTRGG